MGQIYENIVCSIETLHKNSLKKWRVFLIVGNITIITFFSLYGKKWIGDTIFYTLSSIFIIVLIGGIFGWYKKYFIYICDIFVTKNEILFLGDIFPTKKIFFENIEKIFIVQTEGDKIYESNTKSIIIILKDTYKVPYILQTKQTLEELFIDYNTENILSLKNKIRKREIIFIPLCINHADLLHKLRNTSVSILTSI